MLCPSGAAAAMDRAYMSLRARKPHHKTTSDQGSPFRRWTTGGGAGSSYRHHDHRQVFAKQMSEGAPALAGAGGGVARWSLGLEQLLADPAGAAAFSHFLGKEFAAENIRFWRSCEQYRLSDTACRRELAQSIWSQHLADGAPDPVNVDATARRAAAPHHHDDPPPDLFNQAQKQIFNVMKFDSYPRFLRSAVHAECARADLRGQPPPYAPLNTDSDATKLKKSASNASERRRSGGASLLPWRSRAASRDRTPAAPAQPAPPATAPPPDPPVTDVVMSGSLCRVVLPDGATSVVGVSATLPVGRLVERLLARRRLPARAYDVLLTDAAPGEPRAVPPAAPSTALGGRTAAVERRAVLRLQLGARALLVRCRPARRLRHVLRPVVARYCPGATARVTLDGRAVHPDTPAVDLDGARLLLTLDAAPDAGDCATPADTDDDLSDLALRLQDDDDDVSTHSSVSGGSVSWAPPPAPDRVRAALRPGPALHNHPPDFLENLRETQRQRLQARTPPPLPPKPAPRAAPTLV